MPAAFYKHIYKKNFIYLNWKYVLQPRVSEIITGFLKQNEKTICAIEK